MKSRGIGDLNCLFYFIAFLREFERERRGKSMTLLCLGVFFFLFGRGGSCYVPACYTACPTLFPTTHSLFFPYCTLIISLPIIPLPSQRYHHRPFIHSIVRPSFTFHLVSFPNKPQCFSPSFSSPTKLYITYTLSSSPPINQLKTLSPSLLII